MRLFRDKESDDVSFLHVQSEDARPETSGPTSRDEPRQEREEPSPHQAAEPPAEHMEPAPKREEPVVEHAELLAEVRRLKLELGRYRAHAQRTSQLFLSVTTYAEWVRENARRDAELALRKAGARVEKLNKTALELERAEDELARVRDELAHLQHLTDTTRERLSAFLAAGLHALDGDVAAAHDDSPDPALSDLQDTLRERLTSTSAPSPPRTADVEEPAR